MLRTASGSVVTCTLNRPAQYNALSSDMLAALQQALESTSRDPACSVLVLAASGAFCRPRFARMRKPESWQNELFNRCSRLMLTIAELQQPVIATVQGVATAAGLSAGRLLRPSPAVPRSARFATSGSINLGLFCSTPAVALSRSLAPKHAAEMLLTGEFVDAEQAAAWGLVNRCVDDNCLMQEVQSLADQLASKVPLRAGVRKTVAAATTAGQGIRLMQLTNWPRQHGERHVRSGDARRALTLHRQTANAGLERPMSIIDRNVPPPQGGVGHLREWSRQSWWQRYRMSLLVMLPVTTMVMLIAGVAICCSPSFLALCRTRRRRTVGDWRSADRARLYAPA